MIEFKAISKIYEHRSQPSVDAVSLAVADGESLALVGSSGSGKTTLLKMVNRLLEPSSGSVCIKGRDVKNYNLQELRRSIGYVFQNFGLFPHFNVRQNIEISLKLTGWSWSQRHRRVQELLAFMALEPSVYEARFPDQLSGGEQQRVQVARALAADPNILLMDEPFGALDVVTRAELQHEIYRLRQAFKKTIIVVTHDIMEAFRLGDRIAIMHQGQVHQIGTKHELMKKPQTEYVRIFLRAALSGMKQGGLGH